MLRASPAALPQNHLGKLNSEAATLILRGSALTQHGTLWVAFVIRMLGEQPEPPN